MTAAIFAISSSCADAPIEAKGALAAAKALRRLATHWGLEMPHILTTGRVGDLDDPGAIDVHVVPDWSAPMFVGTPATDIAYHTVQNDGRPVCYISWAAVQVNGGTLYGPNGLWSAVTHEMLEALVDPDCDWTCTNPAGQTEPVEVCDRIQGTDYEEDGSPGVFVANALMPAAFNLLSAPRDVVDIASDVRRDYCIRGAFPLTPGGYYAPVDAEPVFGDAHPETHRDEVRRNGFRGSKQRAA